MGARRVGLTLEGPGVMKRVLWILIPRIGHDMIYRLTGWRLIEIRTMNKMDFSIPAMYVWSRKYPL